MPHTGLVNTLKLVYPPISNQEADWLSEDAQVKAILAESNLYMIVQREELFFANYKIYEEDYLVTFDLVCGDKKIENLTLNCTMFLQEHEGEVLFEVGPKIFTLSIKPEDGSDNTMVYWATPDKLWFDYSHKQIQLSNAENFRVFTEFRLHYVGISKKRDSLTRLFVDGHHKRVKILTNESQIRAEGRLSDELIIFFFKIDDFGIRSWNWNEDFELGKEIDRMKILSDAEKAFIKILEAKYNTEDYSKYPRSTDGLFAADVNRATYFIGEDITFHTQNNSIKGSTNYLSIARDGNLGDCIFVDLDTEEVTLVHLEQKMDK